MELGKLGVWMSMDSMTAAAAAAFAKRVEGWGYGALWIPESRGRNALAHSSWLLANTQKLIVATGIANIYARDPMAMANGQRGLNEQSDDRFLLGVGVSHRPMVQGLRGTTTASRWQRCGLISQRCARRLTRRPCRARSR
jgi:alkanesulfonate monooxygenase SsuD/methylene tetrahydromethanopterin reductase-like flavin-dependent oxidoreductase (luciferase family)